MKIKYYGILLALVVVMDCLAGSYIGFWRQSFWTAVEQKDMYNFFRLILGFSYVALVSCLLYTWQNYLSGMMALRVREQFTIKAMLTSYKNIEGGAQRVQEDCFVYPTLLIQLIAGFSKASLMIVAFSILLLMQVSPWFLVFAIVYAVLGTFFAATIAKPLIGLNYINQMFEAKFRQLLHKREEHDKHEMELYYEVHENNYNLFKKTKHLNYFQGFFNQITVIVPYLCLSFVYFSGKITFGILMQVASLMAEIIQNLSFLLNSFSDINKLLACRKRLKEIKII